MESEMDIICAGKWGMNPVHAHLLVSSLTDKHLHIYLSKLNLFCQLEMQKNWFEASRSRSSF